MKRRNKFKFVSYDIFKHIPRVLSKIPPEERGVTGVTRARCGLRPEKWLHMRDFLTPPPPPPPPPPLPTTLEGPC